MYEREEPQAARTKAGRQNIIFIPILALLALLALGIIIYANLRSRPPKGRWDYTIQKEQYFVEYSEQYDYWDVLTVEYPRLEGIDEDLQEEINALMYDAAMDRADFWHFNPDEDVLAFQKEEYQLFCCDVDCDVNYHSQYLVSIHYSEYYAPAEPVWSTRYTERALNIDLMTGEAYGLGDIFTVDEDFIILWCQSVNKEQWAKLFDPEDSETVGIFLSWFHGEDEELEAYYEFRPYFYLTEEGDFVVGISLDPKLRGLGTSAPQNTTFNTRIPAGELEAYRTDSEFWNKYEKSETAGEVLPCQNKEENLWLGEDRGIWSYWEE